jgi:hypothetical protein
MAAPDKQGVWFRWEAPERRPGTRYRVYCGSEKGRYDRVFDTPTPELWIDSIDGWETDEDGAIHAAVRALTPDGGVSKRSADVRFHPHHRRPAEAQEVPIGFQARYVWENVRFWLQERFL